MSSFDDLDLHFGFLKMLRNKNRQNKKRKSMGEALQSSSHVLIHIARAMGKLIMNLAHKYEAVQLSERINIIKKAIKMSSIFCDFFYTHIFT